MMIELRQIADIDPDSPIPFCDLASPGILVLGTLADSQSLLSSALALEKDSERQMRFVLRNTLTLLRTAEETLETALETASRHARLRTPHPCFTRPSRQEPALFVRPLAITDVDTLVPVFIRAYNGPPWHDAWTEAMARRYLGGLAGNPLARVFGIFDGETLQGGLIAQIKYWWEGTEAFIDELFIDPSHQGRGLGQALLAGAETILMEEGVTALTLLTLRGGAAEGFYRRQRFEAKQELGFMVRVCELQSG
ncbi:GNAT family N-acetyltransferase [Chitiniphilus eburneus]|nr:GNAT family N-acetyltransferase [Chitiniphilus eburneus]